LKNLGKPNFYVRGPKISVSVYQIVSLLTRISINLDRFLYISGIHPSFLRDSIETLLMKKGRNLQGDSPAFEIV
jgi:hypothetical protein